jgi:hypothetical protein
MRLQGGGGVVTGGAERGLLSVTSVVWGVSGSWFVGGLGNGARMTATLVAVVTVASVEDQAVVTACVYLYRQLSATVGLVSSRWYFAGCSRRLLFVGLETVLARLCSACWCHWTICSIYRPGCAWLMCRAGLWGGMSGCPSPLRGPYHLRHRLFVLHQEGAEWRRCGVACTRS